MESHNNFQNGMNLQEFANHIADNDIEITRALGGFLCLLVQPKNSSSITSKAFKLASTDIAGMILGEEVCDFITEDCRLYFLWKGKRNNFPNTLSIGRAFDCDICISCPTISKIHAFIKLFVGDDSIKYAITDHMSRNGTWVNGYKLRGMETIPLQTQTVIKLADKIHALVLDAEDLEALCSLLHHSV